MYPAIWPPWALVPEPYPVLAPEPLPEPAASPGDGGMDAGMDGGSGATDAPPEEEIKVMTSATVTLLRKAPVKLRDLECTSLQPIAGIYIIRTPVSCYVGMAANSFRHRFQSRMKTFSDFGIPPSVFTRLLKEVNIECYELRSNVDAMNFTVNKRSSRGKTWQRVRWSSSQEKKVDLLKVLEFWFIQKNVTCRNEPAERVCFEKGSGGLALTIRDEVTGRIERLPVKDPADCRPERRLRST